MLFLYIHNSHCNPSAVRYLAYLCDSTTARCDPDVTFEARDSSGTTLRHSEHVWPSWRHASPHSSVGRLFTPPLAFLFVLSRCGTVTVSPSTCQTPAGVLSFINHSSGLSVSFFPLVFYQTSLHAVSDSCNLSESNHLKFTKDS